MRIIFATLLSLAFAFSAIAQDDCSNAEPLCNGFQLTGTTIGTTAAPGDPSIGCGDNTINNSAWFTVIGTGNGLATLTVSGIDNNPGLEMQVYTGICGSLTPVAGSCRAANGPAGSMTASFSITTGRTYYILVDGTGGNQEDFNIVCSATNNSIVGTPLASFNTNVLRGCTPLSIQAFNQTVLYGGSNITYRWQVDNGSSIPSSGSDTTFQISALGVHTLSLTACNIECGCTQFTRTIYVQELFPTFSFTPANACLGTPIEFSASALIQPAFPPTNPNVSLWQWNFGDPNSGSNNTATGQDVTHEFIGPGNSFTVTLTAFGTCGPETFTQTVNVRSAPVVSAGPPQTICEGATLLLNGTTTNASAPVSWNWTGPGTLSCNDCPSPSVTDIPAGGPYTFSVDIIDNNGCIDDSTVEITVHEKPVVFVNGTLDVCRYDTVAIEAIPLAGVPPLSIQWTPSNVANDTLFSTFAFMGTSEQRFCAVLTDSIGCQSEEDCQQINTYPQPTINASTATLCATSPVLQNTFTVGGAGLGSTYSWAASPNYSLITGATSDSASITASFPPGVAATYIFTAITEDGFTGCRDTISTSFTVTAGLNMSLSMPSQICEGNTTTLSALGATTYTWTSSPGYAFSDSTSAVITVAPTTTTIFTVTGTLGSCSQVLNDTLVVNPRPRAAARPIDGFCGCATLNLTGTGSTVGMNYNWASNTGQPILNSTSLNATAVRCVSDNFTLRVTDPSTGCFRDTTIGVVTRPNPVAVANVVPDLICNGSNTLIALNGTGSNTNPGTTYQWSSNNPGVVINGTSLLNATASVSTATVFFLTVRDSLGCDTVATDTVQIHPLPVISANEPFICRSDPSLTSIIRVSGAGAGSNYNWTAVPSCTTPSSATGESQTFDFAGCGTGTYTFNIIVTDGLTNCVTSLRQEVFVVNGVNMSTSADTSICEGNSVTLIASGANRYIWSTGETNDTISVSGLTNAGSPHEILVTGTIGGCSATDTIEVTVNPVPLTSPVSGPNFICISDTALTYSVTPASGNYSWNIQGGTITSQSGNTVTVNWDSVGTGIISVVDTNSFGCPGSIQTILVTINGLPDTVSIAGPIVVCENSFATYFISGTAGSTYRWTVSNGTISGSSTGSAVTVQWGTAGFGSVFLQETNAANCAGPLLPVNVIINPRPAPAIIDGTPDICVGSTEIYTSPASPGSSYAWLLTNGQLVSVNTGTDTLTSSWPMQGLGTVGLVETNSFGCSSDTALFNVTIYPQPDAGIVDDSVSLCQSESYFALAGSTVGSIQWLTSGSGAFTNDTIQSPTYIPGPSDTGFVTLTMVVASFPCANDTDRVVLFVSPSPVVTITGTDNTICFGSNDTLTATGGGTYLWAPIGLTDSVIIVSPPTTTDYTVSVRNDFGCLTTDTFTVTVIPPGLPNGGPDLVSCIGDSVILSGTQQNAGGLVWSSAGDGTFQPSITDPNVYYQPGIIDTTNGIVQIFLTTTGACLNLQDTVLIELRGLPVVSVGRDTLLTNGYDSSVEVILNGQANNTPSIQWSSTGSGSFVPSDTSLNAIYQPAEADYTLDSVFVVLTATGGCLVVSDSLRIDFTPFIIPNVFTPYPASPGYNDYFEIRNLPRNSSLKIWDRWGLLVFTSDDYRNNWDAANLNSDTYYFILETLNKKFKGWIKVLRD